MGPGGRSARLPGPDSGETEAREGRGTRRPREQGWSPSRPTPGSGAHRPSALALHGAALSPRSRAGEAAACPVAACPAKGHRQAWPDRRGCFGRPPGASLRFVRPCSAGVFATLLTPRGRRPPRPALPGARAQLCGCLGSWGSSWGSRVEPSPRVRCRRWAPRTEPRGGGTHRAPSPLARSSLPPCVCAAAAPRATSGVRDVGRVVGASGPTIRGCLRTTWPLLPPAHSQQSRLTEPQGLWGAW